MAFEYRIDPLRGVVFTTGRGSLTPADVDEARRRLCADSLFRSDLRELLDLSEVTSFEISASDVRDLARHDPFGPGARRAIVAPGDALYGMARMFQMLRDDSGQKIQIFREVPAARRWLGLDEPGDPGKSRGSSAS